MIEFTIKTLDSNNHRFSVDDETTVQQLKEKVMEQMGIEINLQRLIFCGRVLQDEKKLSEYDVHGKVVHLVQRAPPSPESRSDRPTGAGITTHPEPNTQQQIRRLMEGMAGTPDFVLEQQQALTMSPTTGRLEFIRRMIADIKTSLTVLRAHVEGEENRSTPASSEAPVDSPDTEPTAGATQEESEPIFDEFGEEAPDAATRANNARRRSYRAIRALRARHSRPRDLGQLLEELDTLQEQFAPYRSNYIRMLRAANSPEPPEFTEEERQTAQRTVDMVSDIIHSFAHAYHAVSDINFQVGQRIPRLTSESTLLRHQMPMQAHINVVQSSNRRPYQSPHTGQNASTSNAASSIAGGPATQTTSGTLMAPNTAPSTDTSNNQDGLHTHTIPGRNPAQPTVNINIQPEPIYQVEIDARIPIAFPLENSLFNGLSGMMVGNQNLNQQAPQAQAAPQPSQARTAGRTDQGVQAGQTGQTSQVGETGRMGQGGQASQAAQTSQVGQTEQMGQGGQTGQAGQASQVGQTGQMRQGGQTNQTGQTNQVGPTGQMGQGGQAGQDSQAGQANRRQVLLDFENLFRGLSQTDGLGGVEVVMSMEELPQGGALGVGTIYTGNNAADMPQPATGIATATAPPVATGTATMVGSSAGATPPAHFGQTFPPEEGVFVPLPWGPPNADLLQNIVQTMIRQSLPEGMTVQFPGTGAQLHHVPGDTVTFTPLHQFLQTHPHAHIQQIVQAQYNPQAAQQAAQAQQPAQAQPAQQLAQAQQVQQPAQAQQAQQPAPQTQLTSQTVQGPQDQNNRNAQQPHLHFRRATATRTQAVPLVNCIYDRFLQCESTHARRRILRRREQHQQQVAAQQRLRNERIAALNIETLRDRNINLTENNITTMVHLLRSPPSQETWFNALFVTIARHFYLADPMQAVPGEPQLVPNEFPALRTLLRSYIHNLIARSGDRDGENSFMVCSDFFVGQQADFINNMNNITPVREDVDILASLRGLVRSRMPAVVACVMCDVSGEVFAARFYGVFARLFADACALVSHCLADGLDGFRLVFREFMDHIVKNFDPSYHQLFLTLATANFNGMVNNLSNRNIRQYVVRNEGVVDLESDLEGEEPSPMEVSPAPVVREEPMQLSPPTTPAIYDVQARAETPVPEVVVEPISMTSQASTSSVASTSVTPAQTITSTASTHSPLSSHMRTYARINKEKSEPSTPTHNGNRDENLGIVPPLMIVQHWGEEWVPVFTHDQQAQRSEPQEPYSDAYLSGMPSRKRRCVRQARPPTTLDGFMNESVREAADRDRASTVDNSGIRNAFREHMRSIARARASSSEDYDPLRYASAARFLNSTRSKKPQPQENGNKKKDD